IKGSGPDAGVFRYQATLSRLATTFTFSERQATSLSENARESETLARTERDSMQRSQSAALTNALGIQDSFDRTQQRSGVSTTSDGGSTSTQLQKLNSVAREVNRRLGLGEDSIVGKSVVASASVGVVIPLTEIGGQAKAEGRQVDQQKLQSAYDYAHKAVETAQLSEATALVKEFRSSDAYQWARGSRTTGTSGFDSSYREAVDHQSASENAYGRSKELTRAAQFMSEWSSGAQTDFTNYAARRLSERGLLREDDPIKLQRAVTEIAFGYAKGGDVGSQFVTGDSPLAPSNPLPQLLGWGSSTLRDDFGQSDAPRNVDTVRGRAATNNDVVRNDQSRQRVEPGQGVGNDLAGRIRSTESGAATTIDMRRREISQEQGALSEDYNATVQVGKVSPNHSGNKAVWETVGAQADNRAKLGTPSERQSIGEWHMNTDGVPATGPKTGPEDAAGSPDKPERSTKP
ncbi:MAG: hypothetical protein KA271_06635, partial [Propionivibrio sp.]|nr:hypothetical protein [Propionivibrio sp.]